MAYLMRTAFAYPEARPGIVCFALRRLTDRYLAWPLKDLTEGKHIFPALLMLAELGGAIVGMFVYHKSFRRGKSIETGFGPMG